MKRQYGGTFLGFIIGLLVGLGVALAVAMYVAKVPVPFSNRSQSRTPEQDAEEAKKNKDWDPNAPLYGKNPARPASAASAPGKADEARAQDKPDARKPAAADPLGDLAKSKAGDAKSGDGFVYWVQLGAYRTAEDAESQRAKLSLGGIEAKVSERDQSGKTVYRVRVGPFDSRDEAEKSRDKLDKAGQETALVRVQR